MERERPHLSTFGSGFGAGLLTGAAIGAGIGLLWTPRRGTGVPAPHLAAVPALVAGAFDEDLDDPFIPREKSVWGGKSQS